VVVQVTCVRRWPWVNYTAIRGLRTRRLTSRNNLFLTLWSLIPTADVQCNSLATSVADMKRLRLDVVTIRGSWQTVVFSWRLSRWWVLICLVTRRRLKSRLKVEGWTLNCRASSCCWWHSTVCILIDLLRHFQRFVTVFPYEFSATFQRFSCAHVFEMTNLPRRVIVRCSLRYLCNWLASEYVKILDVI
jgi:hypothetical protein